MTKSFEAKKHAYRQTQDGIVVSFVVHPNDVSAALAVTPLGTRYMVAFAEIGDDGQPVATDSINSQMRGTHTPEIAGATHAPAQTKERRPFASLPLSQQAALKCNDNEFKFWLNASNAEDAATKVRKMCDIASRADLDDLKNLTAREAWFGILDDFDAHCTDRQYADTRR